jgi:diaminohydroxyphosphoribosylaminopyrimidine deaminase / 5-amino-6-(5-phosphoribosylamino)uracil reductase
MRRAIEHARRGLGRTTPNPVVGAVVVSDEGVVLGQGAHEFAGGPHAEINALDEAGADGRGATLYCTLEPCSHTGRTGPCSERIIAAGIRRVVAAMEDPFPLVSGRGFAALRTHGIEVDIGVEHDAAVRLNQPFLTAVRTGRPFVILKAATSLDGRIAVEGERTSLSSLGALRHAQYMRATVDAIGVGSETLLIDDPLLTAREVYRERPLARVIFDRRLRTPVSARVLTTLESGPVIIVTARDAEQVDGRGARALRERGATVMPVNGDRIESVLRQLPALGIQSLVIEGGARLHAAVWDEGLVDYVQLYVTPPWLGDEGVPLLSGRNFSSAALHERRVEQIGPDVLIEGYVHRPH